MKIKTFSKNITASIQQQSQKSRNWFLVYQIDKGKSVWRTLGTSDRMIAIQEAERILREIDEQTFGGTKLEELLQTWLKYNAKKSKLYISDAKKHFQIFLDFFENKPADFLTKKDLLDYQVHLENLPSKKDETKTISQTYMSINLKTVKAIWNFNYKNDFINNNLFKNFKIKPAKRRIGYLDKEQLITLINSVKDNELHQNYIMFLIYSGFRASEFYNLKWSDIKSDQIFLRNTKKGRDDIFPLTPTLKNILADIKRLQNKHDEYIFCDSSGRRLNFTTIYRIVKRYMKKCGLSEYNTHTLRHSFATNLIKQKVDVYVVSKLLRHESIKMTENYLQLLGSDIDGDMASLKLYPERKDVVKVIDSIAFAKKTQEFFKVIDAGINKKIEEEVKTSAVESNNKND